ncbi:T6SS phospholipase effector Tle1-like catalytic domain-containing protein [Marinobacter algicola]|uniref:T6SS phospholipase effector Tle1-like catalytic domain-containing protein n=1 Tax=Marinobacter algicola TaxID=236100 RepID=UPI003BA983D8
MGFMDLVPVWDLKAYHLPRIESPFIAAGMAGRLIQNDGSVRARMESAFGPHSRGGHDLAETVRRAVGESRLMLVYTGSGRPLSPVVIWRPDDSLPLGGLWRLSGSGRSAPYAIKKGVAELNACDITPEQLRQYHPQGIGGLGVGLFSANYRQWQRSEKESQEETENHRLSLPLGAAALVAPLTAAALATADTKAAPPKVHLEVGIFTDGTMNNAANARSFAEQLERDCLTPYENDEISREECEWRLAMLAGGSYGNAVTNVAKLQALYMEGELESEGSITYQRFVYAPGAGTKTGDSDKWYGAATGTGEAGVIQQVNYAFSRLALRVKEDLQGQVIDKLTVDLFGFSRGAAAARHAAHEIKQGEKGVLAQLFAENGILWPERVEIRFVGLFDSVAAIVNPLSGDLFAHNDRNHPVKLYLDPGKVGHVVHLTAAHEHRKNFALNSIRNRDGSLPANFREITLPGVHSDIGGGYGDSQREDVLLSPMLQVPENRLKWPEKTVQWDNLEVQRQQVAAEGWIGPYNIPVRQSDQLQAWPRDLGSEGPARLEIVTQRHDHPAPAGRVDLVLRMLREVRGEYSRVAMRLMYGLAVEKGVPLSEIDPTDDTVSVPSELAPVLEQFVEQVAQGEDQPSLDPEYLDLLLQCYIHHSANYNSMETQVAGRPAKMRVLFPHAPASSGERHVYPQKEGE